ncbi:hypothetical protein TRFO_07483 [Tritrichomonas foetus]|uniref:E3 ubiquitin ligase UBR4 C-terminal domain-containing protein n=1 Tax=Tritrichomonas foetus TaxID=1144522 RepID=A0A1J4JVM4_9EUKA|nr:hypothetical protein TRFO_07483 [Tritrichomonas foetus]|eukprot:OHT01588.1 hypothetical protein TRFO_07483 [Tritrichomonas foetus]
MEKFLDLQLDKNSKIPTIEVLLKSVGDSPNAAFYRIANSLHYNNNLNPIYTLVSLRDIIRISPINTKSEVEDEILKPTNSYRWLFLIHSLASKAITNDQELEKAKATYVLQAYYNFINNCSIDKKYTFSLLSGVFCVTARLIDSCQFVPDFFTTEEFYQKLLYYLTLTDFPACQIDIHDFSVQDLFSFCSPISLEYLPPSDLFSSPKLFLSASIIRLLNRILPKSLPTKLDDYKRIIQPFCVHGIIVEPARRVLIHLFNGDENEAYKFSDTLQYQECITILSEKAAKTKNFKYPLNYIESIKLSENLSHIRSVATEHPNHWISFLNSNQGTTDYLLALLQSDYDSDFVIAAATILRMGEAKFTNTKIALNLLIFSRSTILREEISKLLLLQPESISDQILECFPLVCNYGSRSDVFFSFLTELIPKLSNPTKILKALINSIYEESEQIKKLPNSHIYNQLSQYIDVPASYLDPQPCTVCNNPERQPTKKDLNELKDYYKYTHDQIYVKLKQPQIIQTFSLTFSIKKRSRLPRTVHIYVSGSEINTQNELVGDKLNWYHAADLNFPKDTTTCSVELPLRLFATCLKFTFAEFWEDPSSVMTLTCPICRSEITDIRSGLCSKCRENAYQCRECRNINYNHLDAFICCECGFSNFVNFTWTVTSLPSFSHTHIQSESDCDASLKKCDELLAEAHTSYESLTKLQNEIDNVLSPACSLGLNSRTSKLNNLYNTECKSKFQSLTTIVQHVCVIRTAIATYKKRSTHSFSSTSINMCYNCRSTYIKNCLKFFNSVTKYTKDESLDIPKMLFSFANENSIFTSTAIDSLVSFCSEEWELTLNVVDKFTKSLPNVQPQLVRLLCELENVNDIQRSNRLTVFLSAVIESVKFMDYNSSFTPLVLQPLFNAVANSPLIIRSKDIYLKHKAYNSWATKQIKLFDPFDVIISQDFCLTLFTECSSASVRNTIASLYKDASTLSSEHFKKISSIIVSKIEQNNKFNQYDMQLYQVLAFLLQNNEFLVHTLQTNFFDHIIDLLCQEVDNVLASEENVALNLSVGLQSSILMDVVKIYLAPVSHLRYVINRKTELIVRVFTSYFKLRSLLIQRSKYLDNSLMMMKDIIMRTMLKEFDLCSSNQNEKDQIQNLQDSQISDQEEDYFSDDDHEEFTPNTTATLTPATSNEQMSQEDTVKVQNTAGPQILLRSAIKAIEFCPDIVIREIASVIFPPKQVMDVPVIIQKQPSQEDYIPGRLSKQTIYSKQIGETFRDIKMKICNDLSMQHLIEDDHGMELLVNRNIIGLSLSISEVYQRIWVPAHGRKPMMIYCRLQGLDGEATEPMIESFPSEETDDEPPEIKFAYTQVLCENSGFEKFLMPLDDYESISDVALRDLVKLLDTFVLVKRNRVELNRLNSIDKLFDLMTYIISNEGPAELLSQAISITSSLIDDDKSVLHGQDEKVKFIFDSLEKSLLRNNTDTLLSPFLSLIPPLAEASRQLTMTVLSKFLAKLRPETQEGKNTEEKATEEKGLDEKIADESFNFFENSSSLYMLNGFAEFTLALPSNDGEIRDLILREKVVQDAVSYLERIFPISESRTSQKWKSSLEIQCLPMLLKLLAGMVLNHKPTQEFFIASDAKLIKLLLELEAVSSSANIGEFASQVLHNACTEPSICSSVVDGIKKEHANAAKQRAIEEKEKALKLAQLQLSPEYLKMMGELDDQSWECCICKEGYESEPKEQLGVYVYCNQIGDIVNTATYFVCVHPSCHSRDKNTVEQRGRLREWDAAMVRNCERPCNSIFPLPYSSISTNQYKQALIRYIEDNKPRNSQDNFKMFFNDVKKHLDIISKCEKIPLTSGGGSQSSIFELLPFLIYAGHLFLDGDPRKAQESKMQQYIDNPNTSPIDSIVLSLWILNLEEWDFVKLSILKSLLKSAIPKLDEVKDDEIFDKIKNSLILYIIINKIHSMIKVPSGNEPVTNENGKILVKDHKEEKWLHEFYDKINKEGFQLANQFIEFSEEVEDEILEIADLKSAFVYAEINTDEDLISWVKGAIQ